MKAYVVQEPFGIEALALVERPVPEPGPGQVLVRMRAVSLRFHGACPEPPAGMATR